MIADVFALLVLANFAGAVEAEPSPETENMAISQNQFAFDLYQSLRRSQDNVIIAPFSLSMALSMVYAGARGETAKEIAEVLHVSGDPQRVSRNFGDLAQHLVRSWKGSETDLLLINGLWTQRDFELAQPYRELLRMRYEAQVQHVDFAAEPEAARRALNEWIEQRTEGEIRELFPEDSIEADTHLVLTNVLTFAGRWQRPFDPKETTAMPFTTSSGKQVMVPMMSTTAKLRIAQAESFQLLELPYAEGIGAMLILLPREGEALEDLELSVKNLARWRSSLEEEEILVFVPKMDLSERVELKKQLERMGMPLPFSVRADLSGMTERRDLMLSEVVHHVSVAVGEAGTRAKAATGAAAVLRTLPPVFLANRPFLFFVVDRDTELILLMGGV